MITALRLVTPPRCEPLDAGFLQKHTRNFDAGELGLLSVWIAAAREEAERLRGEVFITQTWELTLSGFPRGRQALALPVKPVQSIESITYVDEAGADQTFGTLDGSPAVIQEYVLLRDAQQPKIILKQNASWPIPAVVDNAVTIRFVAGYGNPQDVPPLTKAGMAMLVGHFAENRENVVVGERAVEIPMGIRSLLGVPRVG